MLGRDLVARAQRELLGPLELLAGQPELPPRSMDLSQHDPRRRLRGAGQRGPRGDRLDLVEGGPCSDHRTRMRPGGRHSGIRIGRDPRLDGCGCSYVAAALAPSGRRYGDLAAGTQAGRHRLQAEEPGGGLPQASPGLGSWHFRQRAS